MCIRDSPELGEQPNDDVQTLDNKEVRGSEDVPSESSAPRNENVKATEELVKTPVQSEIDKSFWVRYILFFNHCQRYV